VKSEDNINWITLANDKYSKLYSQMRLTYNIEQEKIKQEQLAIEEKKSKKQSKIIANEKNPFDIIDINASELYLFDFLLFYSELQSRKNENSQNAFESIFGNEACGSSATKAELEAESLSNTTTNNNNSNSAAVRKTEENKLNLVSYFEIALKFKELLNKKKNVFISYSVTDKLNNCEFKGLNLLSLTINPQNLNYKKIKTIIKEISEVQVSTEKVFNNEEHNQIDGFGHLENKAAANSYFTYVNVKIKMKNLFQHLELSSFEVFVNDEDNEFDWFGIKKYQIKEDSNSNYVINDKTRNNINNSDYSNEKIFVNEFDFNFSTNKKGSININRFNVNIIPNLNPDKVITISYIPHPIIVEL